LLEVLGTKQLGNMQQFGASAFLHGSALT